MENFFMPRKILINDSELCYIRDLYLQGYSVNYIARVTNFGYWFIYNQLCKMNIYRKNCSGTSIPIQYDYFSNIDTSNKAYCLGMLYADGHIDKHRFGIHLGLCESDIELLEQIKNLITPNRKLRYIPTSRNRYSLQGMYRLSFGCKVMYQDLVNLGMLEKNFIPVNQFRFAFLRGLFDGDGCISINTGGKNHEALFMGHHNLMQEVYDELTPYLTIHIPKFRRNIWECRIFGRINCIKLRNYLYQDDGLYLKRKYNKFAALDSNIQVISAELSEKPEMVTRTEG